MEKLAVTGKKESKRLRGRSRIRWTDQVSQHLEISASAARNQAVNRIKWNETIQQKATIPSTAWKIEERDTYKYYIKRAPVY